MDYEYDLVAASETTKHDELRQLTTHNLARRLQSAVRVAVVGHAWVMGSRLLGPGSWVLGPASMIRHPTAGCGSVV
eukprot:scaffold569397_cov19-Prasinocladus_malaysianus.AAC.1